MSWALEHPWMTLLLAYCAIDAARAIGVTLAARPKRGA